MERPMYRYTETGSIHRESDGACIPCDPANADFADLMMLGVEIAPFNADVSPFEDLAQAEHDEWLIETAARRALAALKQGYQDEAPQGREQDQPAGSAGSGDLDSAVGDSGRDGAGAGPVRSLELQLEDALTKDAGKLFPPAPDPIDVAGAINARLLHKDDDLNPQAPSDWDMDGQGVVEAVEAEPDDPEKEALRARVAELEAQEPIIVEKIVERVVEVPATPVIEPPADGIPDAFRGLMLVDESPERFTHRMKLRWQALKHMQIDGAKPSLARALPDMSEEERIELADLEARNKITRWLD